MYSLEKQNKTRQINGERNTKVAKQGVPQPLKFKGHCRKTSTLVIKKIVEVEEWTV